MNQDLGMATLLDDLVAANRILAEHGVVDGYGHVSVRVPGRSDRYLLSRSLAPASVTAADIMEYDLDSNPIGGDTRAMYSERFIHGEIYRLRPDVQAVVHNHSPNVVPFTVQKKKKMVPIMHMCAPIGNDIPTWDISHKFGVTNLLVTSVDMGRDLAGCLGNRTVSLMRGHGSVVVGKSLREVVFTSVYMEINAEMLLKAYQLGEGEIEPLSDGEVKANSGARAGFTLERGWENWCRLTGRPYYAQDWNMGPGFSKTDK